MIHTCPQQSRGLGAGGIPQVSHHAACRSYPQPFNENIGSSIRGFLSPTVNFRFSPLKYRCCGHQRQSALTAASLRPPSGKGFGKKSTQEKKTPSQLSEPTSSIQEDEGVNFRKGEDEEDYDDDVVPEVVTNRMLKRIGLTVGVPLLFGILLFPLFYFLKVVTKLDVPEWLPLLVSLFTFGTAGFGITYGVVSTSWDPAREGSFLGWKEAQVNWPLIWQKVKRK